MAFIQKLDPVVLNIKLTTKGRELLSQGRLSYNKFAVGDGEIDYGFIEEAQLDPKDIKILRPADYNPKIISGVPRYSGLDIINDLEGVPTRMSVVENHVMPFGFFEMPDTAFPLQEIMTGKTDGVFVKQPDAMIDIGGVGGGRELNLLQAPTYDIDVNDSEPSVGDILMVKWTNPEIGINTTGYTMNINNPLPVLFYKIEDVVSGTTLSGNTLSLTVDRELPDFGGGGVFAGAMIFHGDIINFMKQVYSVDYMSSAVLGFYENWQCPTIRYPFWNLSVIYRENIIGVDESEIQYTDYKTKKYGGFLSYIQNQSPEIKKLGVIHYTNQSPSNLYGESLSVNNYGNTPVPALVLPTIMWHHSEEKKMGVVFRAIGNGKTLHGASKSLETTYYDLGDERGNVVGKVFTDLKLFVIEDQELLFAMSYKSNRSWTLPKPKIGVGNTIFLGCPECADSFDFDVDLIDVS
jgi:hypothetical protein